MEFDKAQNGEWKKFNRVGEKEKWVNGKYLFI